MNKVKVDGSKHIMDPHRVSKRLFGPKNRLVRYWTMRTYLLELLARLIEIGKNANEDVSAATETLSQLSSSISKDGITPELLSAHMLVLANVQNRQSSSIDILADQSWKLLQENTILDHTALSSLIQVAIGPCSSERVTENRLKRCLRVFGEAMGIWREENERRMKLKKQQEIERQKKREMLILRRKNEKANRVDRTLSVGRRVDLLWPSERKWFRGNHTVQNDTTFILYALEQSINHTRTHRYGSHFGKILGWTKDTVHDTV